MQQAHTDGANDSVTTAYGNSEGFGVGVGMHEGSGQRPLLFATVMEVISGEFRVGLHWELLYVDDLVVTVDSDEEVIRKLMFGGSGKERSKSFYPRLS